MKKKEEDYKILARCLSVLTYIQTRDDVGSILINPIEEDKEKSHWIDLKDGTISIIPKKLSKSGRLIHNLPERNLVWLRDDIKKYPRKYLLTKAKDPHTPRGGISYQFGRWMKLYFGKKVGFNDIRKAYTSWARDNCDAKEFIELAKRQGHGSDVALKYYTQQIPELEN